MTDLFTVRLAVGGVIGIILAGLFLAAYAPQGGDVFSDAVKIGMGALAGALPGFISRAISGAPQDDGPQDVKIVGQPVKTEDV